MTLATISDDLAQPMLFLQLKRPLKEGRNQKFRGRKPPARKLLLKVLVQETNAVALAELVSAQPQAGIGTRCVRFQAGSMTDAPSGYIPLRGRHCHHVKELADRRALKLLGLSCSSNTSRIRLTSPHRRGGAQEEAARLANFAPRSPMRCQKKNRAEVEAYCVWSKNA